MTEQYFEKVQISREAAGSSPIAGADMILHTMQTAGQHQMERQGHHYAELRENGLAYMVDSIDMRIFEAPAAGDILDVSSWPCGMDRASFTRCSEIRRNGELLAVDSSRWILVDLINRRIVSPETADSSEYWVGPFTPAVSPKRLRFPKESYDAFELLDMHTVEAVDCDNNGHMNNIKYLTLVLKCIPELSTGAQIETVRLRFLNECKLGESLEIRELKDVQLRRFRILKADGRLAVEAELKIKEFYR